MRSNGFTTHGGEHAGAVNGSALAEEKRRDEAASDDAGEVPAARTAPSAAAGAGREAYAEAAESRNGSERKPARKTASRNSARKAPKPRVSGDAEREEASEIEIRPGEMELAEDAGSFVDEMHARVDLWECVKRFLLSVDEKVAQRMTERLLEMKYGKGSAPAEEPFQLIVDVPRPIRPPVPELEGESKD